MALRNLPATCLCGPKIACTSPPPRPKLQKKTTSRLGAPSPVTRAPSPVTRRPLSRSLPRPCPFSRDPRLHRRRLGAMADPSASLRPSHLHRI
jgi:hypothetical protein